MDLQITQHDNSTVIVTLRGRFDAFNAGTVKASWQNNEAIRSDILDLSETTFLDSVALATLVQGLKTTRSRRGNFFISDPPAATRTKFELTAIERPLPTT